MERHEFDPISLVFGAAFASVGLVFLSAPIEPSDLEPRWIVPLVAIFLGLLLLAFALRRALPLRQPPPDDGSSASR